MRKPSYRAPYRRARDRIQANPFDAMTSARHGGRPQSCPVSLNASGGTPIVASNRNSFCRAHTSGLSAEIMNGQVAEYAHRPRQPLGLRPLFGRDPLDVRAVFGLLRQRARACAVPALSARASGSGQSVHERSSCIA